MDQDAEIDDAIRTIMSCKSYFPDWMSALKAMKAIGALDDEARRGVAERHKFRSTTVEGLVIGCQNAWKAYELLLRRGASIGPQQLRSIYREFCNEVDDQASMRLAFGARFLATNVRGWRRQV